MFEIRMFAEEDVELQICNMNQMNFDEGPYIIYYGVRNNNIQCYHLKGGPNLPELYIDCSLAPEVEFKSPYTQNQVRDAYYIALKKSKDLSSIVETIIHNNFNNGIAYGQEALRKQFKILLGFK